MKKLVLGLAAAALLAASCSSNTNQKENDEQPAATPVADKISFITVDGNPVYSFKYDEEGRLTFYADLLYKGFYEISYDTLAIKVSYYTPAMEDVEEHLEVVEMYDVKLNDDRFVTEYKARSYDLFGDQKKNMAEATGTVAYDSNGRMTELKESNGRYLALNWDEDGNLLNAQNNQNLYSFMPSTTPNQYNQWMPMWYAAAGYEMTGLFGNAPATLIDGATQKVMNGPSSIARFAYKLSESDLTRSVDVQWGNEDPIKMVFEYTK